MMTLKSMLTGFLFCLLVSLSEAGFCSEMTELEKMTDLQLLQRLKQNSIQLQINNEKSRRDLTEQAKQLAIAHIEITKCKTEITMMQQSLEKTNKSLKSLSSELKAKNNRIKAQRIALIGLGLACIYFAVK